MTPAMIVEAMARAGYEATRTPSFPAWDDVTEAYRADMRRAIEAGLSAARSLGWRLVAPSGDGGA